MPMTIDFAETLHCLRKHPVNSAWAQKAVPTLPGWQAARIFPFRISAELRRQALFKPAMMTYPDGKKMKRNGRNKKAVLLK